MRRTVKKMVNVLTLAAMSVSILSGCNSTADSSSTSTQTDVVTTELTQDDTSEEVVAGYPKEIDMEEEPYTVAIQVVTLPGTQFEGIKEREAAINAITLKAINVNVDIQEVWISEIVNTTSMAVAGGDKIDLIHVATVNSLSSLVGSDILLDLNEENLLANRGPALQDLFGNLLTSGKVNGMQLAVPAKTFNGSGKGIYYNKTMADKYGVTLPEVGTMEDLEAALTAIHEADPAVYPFFLGNGEMNYLYWLQGYEAFGNQAAYGAVLDSTTDTTVENIYATETFKEYALSMYNWRMKGLIPGDPTDTNSAQSYFGAEKLFAIVTDISPLIVTDVESQATFDIGWMTMVEPKITNAGITEYMWGIASSSERPDKAMDFLNFMYENAEVANILNYGLVDVNYTMAEGSDTIININGSYLPLFLRGGNAEQMYVKAPAGEDYISSLVSFEDSATISPITSYMFDDTDYRTEASVINTTILEYLPRIQNGMADSEEDTLALIEEFNQKLSTSGMDDVIVANQEQLDAFIAQQ